MFANLNGSRYKDVLPSNWRKNLDLYVNERKWDSDIVDVMPLILSDMLQKKVQVLHVDKEGSVRSNVFNESLSSSLTLFLENGHYSYIDLPEGAESVGDIFKRDGCDGKVEQVGGAKSWKKPTLVLSFRSNHAKKAMSKAKGDLKFSNKFNVVFRSTSRLVDIVKKCRSNSESIVKSRLKVGSEIEVLDKAKSVCGVVYEAVCKQCSKRGVTNRYIGETGRDLNTRIKEHCKMVNGTASDLMCSAVGEHSVKIHGEQPKFENWVFKILDYSKKTQDRKTLEALHIYKNKPSLNRDLGVNFIILNTKF